MPSDITPDPVELTRELIAFDTVNPPGQEKRCARNILRDWSHVAYSLAEQR